MVDIPVAGLTPAPCISEDSRQMGLYLLVVKPAHTSYSFDLDETMNSPRSRKSSPPTMLCAPPRTAGATCGSMFCTSVHVLI